MNIREIDPKALYAAILTRDRRFDGRVFVGVRSTRIYCRPVCTVRPPKFENCTFYGTHAAAEQAGFRPCLRCRPELAPGSSAAVDAVPKLASLALRRIEDGELSRRSLEELASDFGVSARHLRRSLRQEFGLTPIELAQTQRLLIAKQLLTDTRMSVTEVAYAAGFKSLRRFNTVFKDRYRLIPSSLRMTAVTNRIVNEDGYSFALSVRPPFNWSEMLAFWTARAIPGVEQVGDGWYRRTVVIGKSSGFVAMGTHQKEDSVRVCVSTELGPVLQTVIPRLKAMLDVRADSAEIEEHLSTDPLLAPLVARWPGLRVPGAFNGFECGIRAILGQQISVKAATTLAGRFARQFGNFVSTPFPELSHTFPNSASLASVNASELIALGLTTRRAATVLSFSKAYSDGQVRLEPGADPERTRSALMSIPGIGEWTAEYLLLRALGWPDAFPHSDLGLVHASGLSPTKLLERAEQWRPWRGYAAILLWKSLNDRDSSKSSKGNK